MSETTPATEKPHDTPLIFELGAPGRRAFEIPALDVDPVDEAQCLPAKFLRRTPAALPEVDELQVARHFTNLSKKNFGVDDAFYPLGSCTMKYNPKVNEKAASLPGFARIHPYQPEETVQGMLQLVCELQEYLKDISGLAGVTLMPSAGAHGELTSLMMVRAYHESKNRKPSVILVPDVAHGTNPASCTICGYTTKTVHSGPDGCLDLGDLAANLSEDVAGIMITNPNTIGLFERDIARICEMVHGVGGIVYMDGANMNALLGVARPGDFGIDVMHFNLHKTFSTPHGGGGPGAGPVAVSAALLPFLPGSVAEKQGDRYSWKSMPRSIGRTRGFWGSSGILVRAYAYIRSMGAEGLARVGPIAVLNANYIRKSLAGFYDLPHDRTCMHEVVFSANRQKKNKVRALDIAKCLLDEHIHPPTMYFPMTVPEALMVEPTETENRETMDRFVEVMKRIARDAEENPEKCHEAPLTMSVKRLDEVSAARKPKIRWEPCC